MGQDFLDIHKLEINVCPRSLDPIYVVTYYTEWVKTSLTYSIRAHTLVIDRQTMMLQETGLNSMLNEIATCLKLVNFKLTLRQTANLLLKIY